MAFKKLGFSVTPGLVEEMKVIDSWTEGRPIEELLPRIGKPSDFFAPELPKSSFAELKSRIERLPAGLDILDIGAGIGRTSVFLASRGHRVTVLEPSAESCRILDTVCAQLGLLIDLYQGTAESAAELSAQGARFDLCLFNASLHHCDDPVLALKNCHRLLKPGGKLWLLNEPILKPFRTKRWYLRKLQTDPAAMGHYGGNEHVYYAWEYRAMLRKAGYSVIREVPAHGLTDLRGSLMGLATAASPAGYVYSEKKLVQHFAWTALLSRLIRFEFLRGLLSRFSLLPLAFEAW